MIVTGFGVKGRARANSIIRRVREPDPVSRKPKKIYLTFDDGPDEDGTAAVLDCLNQYGAKATFFVVAEKAAARRDLVSRTLAGGHAIGNHSLDHRYGIFFSSSVQMRGWIERSRDLLKQTGVSKTVGFRPPAGVCTPALFAALERLNEPLVLWSHRFFDTTLAWSEARMREVLPLLRDGDIILLHDRQRPRRLQEFIATLNSFLIEASRLGFQCDGLSRELCEKQSLVQRQNAK